jgi:hypothetical protein
MLSETLCEPDLNLIPAFWKGTKKSTIDHPIWREKRLASLKDRSFLPYLLSHEETDDKIMAILSTAQGTDLYLNSIFHMAEFEKGIRRVIEMMILPTWEKMRSQGDLNQDQIDKELQARMNWQIHQWSDAFAEDRRLSATAGYMTFIGDWKDVDQRRWMEKTGKTIEKMFKRRAGYGPGNINRAKMELDSTTIDLIEELIPDLIAILRVAWPIKDIQKQKKQVKNLPLDKISGKHLNFRWLEVKPNDRLDFLAKIVAEYLLDVTGYPYAIKVLRNPIKKNLPQKPF